MRPSREHLMMATALLWAKRGTCSRLQVGCVVARMPAGRILVQGYNGAPAGLPHCQDRLTEGLPQVKEHTPEECRAVHAEQNAIAWAARTGVALEGAEMFCTHQPCLSCARSIINAGIIRVSYAQPYRLIEGIELLVEAGIGVVPMVDFATSS